MNNVGPIHYEQWTSGYFLIKIVHMTLYWCDASYFFFSLWYDFYLNVEKFGIHFIKFSNSLEKYLFLFLFYVNQAGINKILIIFIHLWLTENSNKAVCWRQCMYVKQNSYIVLTPSKSCLFLFLRLTWKWRGTNFYVEFLDIYSTLFVYLFFSNCCKRLKSCCRCSKYTYLSDFCLLNFST